MGELCTVYKQTYPFFKEFYSIFYHNTVRLDGGAIQTVSTTLQFGESSSVIFSSNSALQQGGALNLFHSSIVTFQDDSNITFTHNTAMQHGGAVYVHDNISVSFVGNTKVTIWQKVMVEHYILMTIVTLQ